MELVESKTVWFSHVFVCKNLGNTSTASSCFICAWYQPKSQVTPENPQADWSKEKSTDRSSVYFRQEQCLGWSRPICYIIGWQVRTVQAAPCRSVTQKYQQQFYGTYYITYSRFLTLTATGSLSSSLNVPCLQANNEKHLYWGIKKHTLWVIHHVVVLSQTDG